MPKVSRREHLIQTALELFAQHGYHGAGINLILEKAGVSKKTLYHHFRSKEELILAVLQHYDGLFRNHFMRRVEELEPEPGKRIGAVFDVAEEWFRESRFFGCMFINVIGEYSDRESPFRQICRQFKAMMRRYFVHLCREADVADAATLGEEIAMLFEGAIVTAQISRQPEVARTAKRAAGILLDRALSTELAHG